MNGRVTKIEIWGLENESSWAPLIPFNDYLLDMPIIKDIESEWDASTRRQIVKFDGHKICTAFGITLSLIPFVNVVEYYGTKKHSKHLRDKSSEKISEIQKATEGHHKRQGNEKKENKQKPLRGRNMELSFLNKGKEVSWMALKLPRLVGQIQSDLDLIYMIDDPKDTDRVYVYYTDKASNIKPSSLKFQVQ